LTNAFSISRKFSSSTVSFSNLSFLALQEKTQTRIVEISKFSNSFGRTFPFFSSDFYGNPQKVENPTTKKFYVHVRLNRVPTLPTAFGFFQSLPLCALSPADRDDSPPSLIVRQLHLGKEFM